MSEIDRLEKLLQSEGDRSFSIRPDGTIEEVEVSAGLIENNPIRQAWNAYAATNAFKRSKGWALQIAPFDTATEQQKRFELMPLEYRESNVEGAMWAAFMTGWEAALRTAPQPSEALEG